MLARIERFLGEWRQALPLASLCLTVLATTAVAGSTVTTKADFDDVMFAVNSAIVDRGYKIDLTGDVGAMLSRTGDAVGATSVYKNARYVQFCSAKLTHDVTSADPANLSICPYVIYAYETRAEPGTVTIGYRQPAGTTTTASQAAIVKVEALLKEIIEEAARCDEADCRRARAPTNAASLRRSELHQRALEVKVPAPSQDQGAGARRMHLTD